MPPFKSSEDETNESILSSIPGLDEETAASTSSEGSDGEGASTSAETTAPATTAPAASEGTAPATTPGSTTDAAPKDLAAERVIYRRDGLIEKASKDGSGARDLVDPKTGEVVARGGNERRYFENAQKATRQLQAQTTELQQLRQQQASAGEVTKLATDLQLPVADQKIAMQMLSDFYKDPVKQLAALVSEVKAKGYPVDQLLGMQPTIDYAAMQKMIDSKLAPVTQQRNQQQEVAKAQAEVKQELETFLSHNEDAYANLNIIAQAMDKDKTLTLERAFLAVTRWAGQNGYDYTQPLEAQVLARQNAGQQQQPAPVASRQQPAIAPLPNGRQANNGAAPVGGETVAFDENADWKDIIRHAMKG